MIEKSLNSITYDTIREKQESEKKGLFGRLGNAISGESDVNKEKVEKDKFLLRPPKIDPKSEKLV